MLAMHRGQEQSPEDGESLGEKDVFQGRVVDWVLGQDEALDELIDDMEQRRPGREASDEEVEAYNLELAKLLGRKEMLNEASAALVELQQGIPEQPLGEPTLPFSPPDDAAAV